ncbi:ribonuclease HI family protein [bacterium]|nr:ribonuclease HI family protein [bacterium]
MPTYKLFTDGGARGNPGPAGIGGVLYNSKDEVVADFSVYLGETTNNQAEYKALLKGLELALENKVEDLESFLDSELVVKQLNREYKVKNKDLALLFVKAWNLSLSFRKITFQHVYREQNKAADALANEAMDRAL